MSPFESSVVSLIRTDTIHVSAQVVNALHERFDGLKDAALTTKVMKGRQESEVHPPPPPRTIKSIPSNENCLIAGFEDMFHNLQPV